MFTVKDIMTNSLYTLPTTASIGDAHQLMDEYNIHHVPVVDENNHLVGLLTQRDLLRASVSSFADVTAEQRIEIEASIPLTEVMTKDVVVAEQDAPLADIAEHLLNKGHGCLPVVNSEGIQGIVTEADFVKLAVKLLDR